MSAGELTIEKCPLDSATVGDCNGLCTGSSSACDKAVTMGGSRGVDASFSRSIGSSSSVRLMSIGETGTLSASAAEVFRDRSTGLLSFCSTLWYMELVTEDERVDGGQEDVEI